MFTVAIIGRPNVGKSTLFNKLVGKPVAIVNDYIGVTRDRKESIGNIGPLEFKIIDTPGWSIDDNKKEFEKKMMEQTEIAINEADLCLFVVDYRNGITKVDLNFAEKLRKISDKVILIANKCDENKEIIFDKDYYKLGFNNPIPVSAEHNNGFNLLYDFIEPYYNKYLENTKNIDEVDSIESNLKDDKPLQLAIVGRPNTGKSTLINQLIGYDRVVTGEEAGITRDSIAIDWEYKGRKIKLIDTAGIRKKRNIFENIEKMSVDESMRSIVFAQVAIMMIDSTRAFDEQDLSIMSLLVKEGRGVVFALNKWDMVEDKHKFMNESIKIVENSTPELKGCPIIPLSALNGYNIDKLMNAVFDVFKDWNIYIPTSKLNKWIKIVEEEHTPPLYKGKTTKLKYITQAKRRPPTFVLFTNNPDKLKSTNYDRYLVNKLREDFKLKGTIVRILMRKSENPYINKK